MLRLFAAVSCASLAAALDPTIQTMVDRIKGQVTVQPQNVAQWDSSVDYFMRLLQPDYTFSDLEYTYQTAAIWPAYNHTKRAEWMTEAWLSPGSKYFQDEAFLNTTLRVLDYWLLHYPSTVIPEQGNWWWNTIGVPISLGITVNMLADYLLANQTAAAVTILTKANPSGFTACNLVWTCEGTVYRGLLQQNLTTIQYALDLSFATVTLAPGSEEGIKADGSFMQHGMQLYNGGYGMSYAQGIAMFLSWTHGTPLGLNDTDARVQIFSDFMIGGSLRMQRYSMPPQGSDGISASGEPYAPALWDMNTVGRDITRPYGSNWNNQAGVTVQWTPTLIADVGGPRSTAFQGFGALLNGSATMDQRMQLTVGSKVYYIGDYVLHSSAAGTYSGLSNGSALGWMATVRMASNRTLRCECINGENLHGLHLSDGVLWLYLDGYEYVDTMPVWDWMRLPGTTVLPYAVPWSCGGSGTTAFVGGASLDAAAGGPTATLAAVAHDYKAADNEGLTLRKSVFFYPDLYIALGSNVTAAPARSTLPAWTTVAQRRLRSTGVYTSQTGTGCPIPDNTNTSLAYGVWWVWEGGIGYVFPDAYTAAHTASATATASSIFLSNLVQNGTWQSVGAMSGNASFAMFTLWLEHAAPVVNGSYSYIVVPNIRLDELEAAATTLVTAAVSDGGVLIVRNDAEAQSVLFAGLPGRCSQSGVAMQANVFAIDPGSAVSALPGGKGWTVTVSAVGSYIVQETLASTSLSFSVAQPGQVGPWSPALVIDRTIVPGPSTPNSNATCTGGTSGQAQGIVFTNAQVDGSTITASCNTQ